MTRRNFIPTVFTLVLTLVLPVFAEGSGDAEAIARMQELQRRIYELTQKAGELEATIHQFVEQANEDGFLDAEEEAKLQDLVAEADETAKEIEELKHELEELRGDTEDQAIENYSHFLMLLARAHSFVYVASPKVEGRVSDALTAIHRHLVAGLANPSMTSRPFIPLVRYSGKTYPVLFGVLVMTNSGGWSRPTTPPPTASSIAAFYAGAGPLGDLLYPFAKVMPSPIPAPVVMFDAIDVEHKVEVANIAFNLGGGTTVTIPIPWKITPEIHKRVYVLDSELVMDSQHGRPGRYTYLEDDFDKLLGPFLDAFYR